MSKVSLSIRHLSKASLGGVHTASDADGDAGRREGVWRSGGEGGGRGGDRRGCCRDASFVVVVFVLSVFFAAF